MKKLFYTLIDLKTNIEFTFKASDLMELFDFQIDSSEYIRRNVSNTSDSTTGTFKIKLKGENPKIVRGNVQEYDDLLEILISRGHR